MVASLLALALAVIPIHQQDSAPEAIVASFLDAFSGMDEARFDNFFAPDVTMFFPDGPFPEGRVEGKQAVLAAFHSFFKLVKERGRKTLNIVPLDQRVQLFGDVAVVTFRLDGDETIGRRSIIFRKIDDNWRIAHFHASSIEK